MNFNFENIKDTAKEKIRNVSEKIKKTPGSIKDKSIDIWKKATFDDGKKTKVERVKSMTKATLKGGLIGTGGVFAAGAGLFAMLATGLIGAMKDGWNKGSSWMGK